MREWLFSNAHVILWAAGCGLGFVAATLVLHARGVLGARTIIALCWAWLGLMLGGVWQARLESMPFRDALLLSPVDIVTSGGRLPLGLATGVVFAGLWCLVSRAPWRSTGDALAVAAPVAIIVGRFGCLVAGCCTGTMCGRWAVPFICLDHGRRSEIFARQFARGLVDTTSAAALPTHPLPVYFMAAAIVLLAILLWQLRRGFPPGTLLVTFGVLWPLGKLGLEQLRETPRPPGLMLGVPIAMIVAACITAIVLGIRPARLTRRPRPVHSGCATKS